MKLAKKVGSMDKSQKRELLRLIEALDTLSPAVFDKLLTQARLTKYQIDVLADELHRDIELENL